jgi:hypothetical protein
MGKLQVHKKRVNKNQEHTGAQALFSKFSTKMKQGGSRYSQRGKGCG